MTSIDPSNEYDVIIIGAGAAGLMCAITAGQRGRRVLVLDHANKVGKKILMSGGGRCNFTNMYCGPDNFISANPHFVKSALSRYTPWHFIELVERHQIAYHEKKLGQLFCDQSSKDIVQLLLAECEAAGVTILLNTPVKVLDCGEQKQVEVSQGRLRSKSLVIATGGLSIPKMGATSFGLSLAQSLGISVLPTTPVYFVFLLYVIILKLLPPVLKDMIRARTVPPMKIQLNQFLEFVTSSLDETCIKGHL